jgi:hypothetical protein
MRVLLQGFGREVDTDGAAGSVILQQPFLMRQQKKVLYVPRRQKVKLPVFVGEERTACRTLASQTQGQIGEGRHGQREIGQALSGTALEDSEVAQSGKKAPSDSDGRCLRPWAPLS